MNNKLTLVLIALIVAISACKRDTPGVAEEETSSPSAQVVAAKNLIAPSGFNFDTEKELLVRVKIADAQPNTRYGIRIYADVPSTGKIICTGATNLDAEYSTTLKIPAWNDVIYIEKVNPDGSSNFEKVSANRFATALFTNGTQPQPYYMRKSSGLDCSTGCTLVYNNPTSDITVPANTNACITGTIGSNVSLTTSGSSNIRVCASGTFTSYTGGYLTVLEGAVLKINSVTSIYSITNWSDSLWIDQSGYVGGQFFVNYGKCYVNNITTGNQISNHGSLIVSGNFYIPGYNSGYNYGYLKVGGTLTCGTLGTFTNNCHIEATYVSQQGDFRNSGYVKVTETFDHNTTNTEWPNSTSVYPGSMISTKNLNIGFGTFGGSTSAIIKVGNNTTLSNASLGAMTICDINGIELVSGTNPANVTFSCDGYIATSTCNPEGFGSSSVQDTDNDGITDAFDEYPNDATKAFNSYYPAANSIATVAFEDLWPDLGDYDFNDLAVTFNIQQILNADNKVVEYKVKMKVKAVGGSFENGLGFQLDELVPADISSVTGQVLVKNLITRNANNTEAGQNKAVIICFDSPEPVIHRVTGSMFNTIKTNGTGTSDSMTINIAFSSPIDAAKLSISKFNPFIFTKQRRGYEIHLPDYKPTTLADANVFGTQSDYTIPSLNKYYKTVNGLPWAMLVPQDFAYAKEKSAITSAYNYFDDWVLSGGGAYTSWYTNAVGNQNSADVY